MSEHEVLHELHTKMPEPEPVPEIDWQPMAELSDAEPEAGA